MRFSKSGLIGATFALTASSAAAQSSVTLYGVTDAFFQFLDNGGKKSESLRSGGNSGSLFGLKGTENLGGGLSAVFTLENGYNINSGTFLADSSAVFYRQAWVGLAHEKYGTVTLGRQYQPTFWVLYPTDPMRANEILSPLAAASQSVDRATLATQTGGGRSSNAIVYKSPNLFGLQLWAMYALSATVTQPLPQTYGNMIDIAATYSGYGLYAGMSYMYQHAGSKTFPMLPASLNTVSVRHYTGAVAYRFGIVNVSFNYAYHQPDDAPANSLAGRLNVAHPFSVMEVGATIQATPFDTVELAGFQRVVRGAHDNTWGVELGMDHSLSKRTALYARVGYIKNNGLATVSWPGITTNGTEAPQTLAGVGMTHRF
jgi:predicted porin